MGKFSGIALSKPQARCRGTSAWLAVSRRAQRGRGAHSVDGRGYDFDTGVGAVAGALALCSIVVADGVGIFFVELVRWGNRCKLGPPEAQSFLHWQADALSCPPLIKF